MIYDLCLVFELNHRHKNSLYYCFPPSLLSLPPFLTFFFLSFFLPFWQIKFHRFFFVKLKQWCQFIFKSEHYLHAEYSDLLEKINNENMLQKSIFIPHLLFLLSFLSSVSHFQLEKCTSQKTARFFVQQSISNHLQIKKSNILA